MVNEQLQSLVETTDCSICKGSRTVLNYYPHPMNEFYGKIKYTLLEDCVCVAAWAAGVPDDMKVEDFE